MSELKGLFSIFLAVLGFVLCVPAQSQEKTLNLYSSRHYQTDEALYRNFIQRTGIAINRNLYPLKVDPTRDLTAVGLVASTPLLLYVNAELPAKSVAELVDLLTKRLRVRGLCGRARHCGPEEEPARQNRRGHPLRGSHRFSPMRQRVTHAPRLTNEAEG